MANYLHKYTRAQAIDDGVLVDITNYSKDLGFKYPVAVTEAVRNLLNPSDELKAEGQDIIGRTWDMLFILKFYIHKLTDQKTDRLDFSPLFVMEKGKRAEPVALWAHVGPGDNFEPVITVMMQGED